MLYSKKLELQALYVLTLNTKDSTKLLAKLDVNHFHFPATKAAFSRFLSILRSKNEFMDWSSLIEDPALSEDDRAFLASYSKKDKINIESLFHTLEQYRVGRAIYALTQHAIESLKSSFDADNLLDELADMLSQARTVSEDQKLYHLGAGNNTSKIVESLLDMSIKPAVIPTGFPTYDSLVGGFPDSGLVILAATTSSGKSAMSNQLALNINRIGWDVCKVSLEMTESEEIERILANQTSIDHSKIRNKKLTPSEVKIIKKAYKDFVRKNKEGGTRLTILSPTEDLTLTQIFMLLKPYDYRVIIIDYISLLKEQKNVEQWKHLSDVAREAKRYSLKNNCLIIMLAQLDDDNRIRYSRAIKEHADVVWTWSVTDADRESERFTVHQVKGRNLGVLSFEVSAKFECMRIFDAGSASGEGEDDRGDDEGVDISDLMS